MPDSKNTSVVSATYNSPANESFTATSNITTTTPIPSAALSLEDKTKFLQDLRASVAAVQDQVNKELTQRMDEDKAREVAAGATVDEAKEEENYGEEVVDEDDA
ncbi:hypothetical protein MAPG_10932 [Magnaporthiopsis poae ATCC 64411]|uniref:EKC/KEOPS complex subunit GON7 n=1 Tax=Magnaporthiopsis poae (strain ATCC 64411 / 73-15) TaxID=644358 RepID=A0A0C4EDX2_MAGP6|nr:hypothetical protein MAPG_10932 [Magnaporthiopsis poae ATCC 64411]